MHVARLKCGVACALVLALVSGAFAQGTGSTPIAVAPVIVKMDTLTEFSAVEVSNRGDRATSLEISVVQVKWTEGREVYEPTRDFTVSPPVFRLQEGKSRMVRFRYAGTRQQTEGFYRLFVRQLPEEVAGSQISMVFNLGIPIFIAPLTSQPALSIDAGTATGKLPELLNTGNVTLTVMELEGSSCPGGPQKILARLSPAQKFVLKQGFSPCATSARTDRGLIQLTAR